MRSFLISFLMLFFILVYSSASAQDGRYYLDMNTGFKTGDFGTSTRSNLFYFSPGIGYIAQRYDLSMSGSFLVLRNSGQSGTEAGTGDVVIRGGGLLPGDSDRISIYGSLAVKLPLADENKGLGTGQADYGAFVEMSKKADEKRFFLRTGYIKTGNSPSVDYNDIYLYGFGVSRIFGKTDFEVSLDGRRSIIPGAKNPLELNLSIFHILNKNYSLKYSNFIGLNNGGPDFGLNFGFTRWF